MFQPVPGKTKALLETGRVSNIPTIWSNVIVGWVFAGSQDYTSLFLISMASSLLYVGGCFIGDARDVGFDKINRPERPIPTGILSSSFVLNTGILFMLIGFLGFISIESDLKIILLSSFPLVTCIFLYALLHKLSPYIGLPLIGGCRALLLWSTFVIFRGENAAASAWVIASALALLLYTMSFASVARLESSKRSIDFSLALKILMFLCPIPLLFIATHANPIQFSLSYFIYSVWLGFAFSKLRDNKGSFVEASLAGFALLDTTLISSFGWELQGICLALFFLSLFLQRVSPAT